MPIPQKETPASGYNHAAGANTQNTGEIVTEVQTTGKRFAPLRALMSLPVRGRQVGRDRLPPGPLANQQNKVKHYRSRR